MIILAIETATTACAIGLLDADGTTTECVLDESRRHTEVLVPGIDSLLRGRGITPRDLDRVVVDRGPGLFTGLRVGIATASSLAQALGCALVSATSLELLAHGARALGVRGTTLCAVDGRRGEVFTQTFRVDGAVVAVDRPFVAQPRDIIEEWRRRGEPVTLVGDGVVRYASEFSLLPGATLLSTSVPSVAAALDLARTRAVEAAVAPLYLREADAVANFSTRQRP